MADVKGLIERLEDGARAFRADAEGRSMALSDKLGATIRDSHADAKADFAEAVVELARAVPSKGGA